MAPDDGTLKFTEIGQVFLNLGGKSWDFSYFILNFHLDICSLT